MAVFCVAPKPQKILDSNKKVRFDLGDASYSDSVANYDSGHDSGISTSINKNRLEKEQEKKFGLSVSSILNVEQDIFDLAIEVISLHYYYYYLKTIIFINNLDFNFRNRKHLK